MAPPRLTWTFHALERLSERGLTREAVEQSVRALHPNRRPNHGDADWRIDAGSFSVLYDYPAGREMNTIRIITAWPKRHKPKRHLEQVKYKEPGLS